MSTARTVYENHGTNTRYLGYVLNGDFEGYMRDRVGPRYRDDEGDQLLSDVDNTEQVGFDSKVLKASIPYIPSRIAEVMAECFLMDRHGVLIPYNRVRDAISLTASPAGPDIIGIVGTLFVFGETKSSSEPRHPPSVVNGSAGMIEQLNNIKRDKEKRSRMIRWLGHKTVRFEADANHASWRRAKRQYYESEGRSFKICGILVRDTDPNERDVVKVHDKVSADIYPSTPLDVMALYIPVPIQSLPDVVMV